jgi:hypothetical protein
MYVNHSCATRRIASIAAGSSLDRAYISINELLYNLRGERVVLETGSSSLRMHANVGQEHSGFYGSWIPQSLPHAHVRSHKIIGSVP